MKKVVIRLHGTLCTGSSVCEVEVLVPEGEGLASIVRKVLRDHLGGRSVDNVLESLMFMVGEDVVYEDYVPKEGEVVDVYPLSFGG